MPHRLPPHVVNGIAVAAGVAAVQLGFGALAGAHVAHVASGGAVCASLADLPNTPSRTWRQVLIAAALAVAAAMVVALARPSAAGMTGGIAAIGFIAMMTMAWGVRAAPVSFAPILALVFAMSAPPAPNPLEPVAWTAAGALAYLAWSVTTGFLLQRSWRRFALAGALRAMALLLRSRAEVIEAGGARLGATVLDESALAERLQAARNLLFVAPDSPASRRDSAALLRVIELRDVLLASRLDLELFGEDALGRFVRHRVAARLREFAAALDASADEAPADETLAAAPPLFTDAPAAGDDARLRLLPALEDRLQHLADDVARIAALRGGGDEPLPLPREALRRFVAPEAWPVSALGAQLNPGSPVLRHAVRVALALACAYAIALASPWASHPHWLVLSVAVVLRGDLHQTLARRNARVLGTAAGCAVVLVLAQLPSAAWLSAVFLAAVALAHAYAVVQYAITSAAGTVMALLQAHLMAPDQGFAIGERLADTLLGALLAWAFSYVLPSWQRRHLPDAVVRTLKALQDYAQQALGDTEGAASVAQRLARRRAYDALGALALSLSRGAVEPRRVRVPERELAELLDHGHRLMAHLSLVRVTLARRSKALRGDDLRAELETTRHALAVALTPGARVAEPPDAPAWLAPLPGTLPTEDIAPWLRRRLEVSMHDGRRVGHAAAALLGRLRASR